MKLITIILILTLAVVVMAQQSSSGFISLWTGTERADSVLFQSEGKIGVHTTNPTADFHHVAQGDQTHVMRFTPNDTTVDWAHSFGEFPNSGSSRNNQVTYMGWNLAPGGGLNVQGQAANGLSFEDYYAPANDPNGPYSESHLFYVTPQGVQRRPWSFVVSQNSGDGIGNINIGTFQHRDITGSTCFSEISAAAFSTYVPSRLGGDLQVMNPANQSLQLARIKASVSGGTDPILILGQNDTEYPSVEVGQAEPSKSRRGGSLYLQTSGSLKHDDGTPVWGYDQYMGWQRVALGGFFLDNVTLLNGQSLLFGGGSIYAPRDAGIVRVSAARLRVSDGSTDHGAMEVGTLYLKDGTVKQVTYGVANSGGAGFKVLRIAN